MQAKMAKLQPIVSCPHCGESYITAETMHEIERIELY